MLLHTRILEALSRIAKALDVICMFLLFAGLFALAFGPDFLIVLATGLAESIKANPANFLIVSASASLIAHFVATFTGTIGKNMRNEQRTALDLVRQEKWFGPKRSG